MSTLEDLETQLVSSRKVREFLKLFSETQWSRVVKASVIMGIQELEKSQTLLTKLSAADLEDLVVKNETEIQMSRARSTSQNSQNLAKKGSSRNHLISRPSSQPQQQLSSRRGARPTQGTNSKPLRSESSREATQERRPNRFMQEQQETRQLQSQPSFDRLAPTAKIAQRHIEGTRAVNRVSSEARAIQLKQTPAQQLNTDRPRSLNPLIYPTWWGDNEAEASTEQHPERRTKEKSNQKHAKNTFQLAAAQIEHGIPSGNMFQESMQASSTVSLKDALQQAKETAYRLDKEILESQRYRAAFLKNSDGKAEQIVNLQVLDQQPATRNQKGKENSQRNKNQPPVQQQVIMVQNTSQPVHSQKASKNTQQKRQTHADFRSNNPREVVTPKNPVYLRNVESKIKDQIRMTRTQMMYHNQNPNYDIPIEIFEGPKPRQRASREQESRQDKNQDQPANARPGSAAQLKYKQKSNIQEPNIIRKQKNRQQQIPESTRKNKQLKELLDSPFLGQFCDDNNQELIDQSQDQSLASSSRSNRQSGINRQYQQQQQYYDDREAETLGAVQRKGNQPPTYHNQVLSQTGPKQPANKFSMDNTNTSSSMVVYNGTGNQRLHQMQQAVQYQVPSSDSSSLLFQHQQDKHAILSQGTNQIFFDSKAFDKIPSQYFNHQNQNNTLNNPFSMEQPLLSSSQDVCDDQEQSQSRDSRIEQSNEEYQDQAEDENQSSYQQQNNVRERDYDHRVQYQQKPGGMQNYIEQVDQHKIDEYQKMMTFKSQQALSSSDYQIDQSRDIQNHKTFLAPNGTGVGAYNDYTKNTVTTSSNFGERATSKTLKEMQNPFLSRAYRNDMGIGESSNEVNSNIYSYHASMGQPTSNQYRGQQIRSELSSPHDDDSSNLTNGIKRNLDSNGDPSSSSMSGYDIKGMFTRQQQIQNQQQQYQQYNNHQEIQQREKQQRPFSAHNHAKSQLPQNLYQDDHREHQIPPAHIQSQNAAIISDGSNSKPYSGAPSQNATNYHYQQHVVSQDFNPLKTTLGNDETERDESAIYSNQGKPHYQRHQQRAPATPQYKEQQKLNSKRDHDTESTVSDDQLVDQYEMMQAQMKKIREQHGLNPIQQNYYQQKQSESSSDLSSDDDIEQTSGVGGSSTSSLSQSMASEKNVYGQASQKRPIIAPFSHPKYLVY